MRKSESLESVTKRFRRTHVHDLAPERNQLIRSTATNEVSLRSDLVTRGLHDAAMLLRSPQLLQKAEAGDAEAQLELGDIYHDGFEGKGPKYVEAAYWYRKAADQGNARAQYAIGRAHDRGLGVTLDRQEAIKWYQRSAKQSDKEAILALGEVFDSGSLARQLAIERPNHWEYLLIAELLRCHVPDLQKRYSALDHELLSEPTVCLRTIVDASKWLGEQMQTVKQLASDLVTKRWSNDLNSACGEPGQPGDPVEILNAVNKLVKICESFIEWERMTLLTQPPSGLSRRGWFRGSVVNIIDIPAYLGRDRQSGKRKATGHTKNTFDYRDGHTTDAAIRKLLSRANEDRARPIRKLVSRTNKAMARQTTTDHRAYCCGAEGQISRRGCDREDGCRGGARAIIHGA